ncbi:MAG TPA: polyprenol monophosphomannose synthase [Anaerolineae bacterium]|nr:polyprenol monophosphomannose synthase [Anaerolineae bacterium]
MKPIVVVPTYDEAENIPKLVAALFALQVPELEVLVVDDQSPDGTGELVERLISGYTGRLHALHRAGPRGLGRAYLDGFRWALDCGADAVIQMDADFSHSPTYVPRFLSFVQEYEVIVGSRYVVGGELDTEWEAGRVLLSAWANIYARNILRMRTHDVTAGFKCWRRSALEAVRLDRVRSNGYVFQVEMAYLSERLGLRILEAPIYFEDRRIGKSKMSIPVKVEAAWRVWQVWLRHRRVRPLPLRKL